MGDACLWKLFIELHVKGRGWDVHARGMWKSRAEDGHVDQWCSCHVDVADLVEEVH